MEVHGGGYSADQRPARPVLEGGSTPQLQGAGDEVLLLVYYLGGWNGGRTGVLSGLPHCLVNTPKQFQYPPSFSSPPL